MPSARVSNTIRTRQVDRVTAGVQEVISIDGRAFITEENVIATRRKLTSVSLHQCCGDPLIAAMLNDGRPMLCGPLLSIARIKRRGQRYDTFPEETGMVRINQDSIRQDSSCSFSVPVDGIHANKAADGEIAAFFCHRFMRQFRCGAGNGCRNIPAFPPA